MFHYMNGEIFMNSVDLASSFLFVQVSAFVQENLLLPVELYEQTESCDKQELYAPAEPFGKNYAGEEETFHD